FRTDHQRLGGRCPLVDRQDVHEEKPSAIGDQPSVRRVRSMHPFARRNRVHEVHPTDLVAALRAHTVVAFACAMNARIFARFLVPSGSSTPVCTSTPHGSTRRIAVATLSGVSPPARMIGTRTAWTSARLTSQSCVLPVAPPRPLTGS